MTSTRLLRSAAAPAALVLTLVLALGACGSDGSSTATSPGTAGADKTAPGTAGGGDQIEVKDFAFKPGNAKVKVGTKVTWTFKDSAAHNVDPVGSSELKKSDDLKDGGAYAFTFTKAGKVSYRCGIHNFMTGTIEVTA